MNPTWFRDFEDGGGESRLEASETASQISIEAHIRRVVKHDWFPPNGARASRPYHRRMQVVNTGGEPFKSGETVQAGEMNEDNLVEGKRKHNARLRRRRREAKKSAYTCAEGDAFMMEETDRKRYQEGSREKAQRALETTAERVKRRIYARRDSSQGGGRWDQTDRTTWTRLREKGSFLRRRRRGVKGAYEYAREIHPSATDDGDDVHGDRDIWTFERGFRPIHWTASRGPRKLEGEGIEQRKHMRALTHRAASDGARRVGWHPATVTIHEIDEIAAARVKVLRCIFIPD
ncbi:hypothetical protein B0H11DRAFT_2410771 [Mycena galericulata]|nr:hypothetical protein B0H11DRAFT_2410771 [Mycena galericulata]